MLRAKLLRSIFQAAVHRLPVTISLFITESRKLMKILCSHRRTRSGQILAEACIGLALMVFAWIVITYLLFMGNNQIRTTMAARHAAWYRGAGTTEATAGQIDQWFFYQSGLSKVEYSKGKGIFDVLAGGSADASKYSADEDGPWIATVTFGISDVNSASQFPFTMLKTHVPFMPDSALTQGLSVKAFCQWDEVGNTWTSPGAALKGIFDAIKQVFTSAFS
jgi:hypothetical protein